MHKPQRLRFRGPVPRTPVRDVTDEFRLALLQRPANPDGADALDAAIEDLREAAARGGQILVLPELFRSPYFCQEMTPDGFGLAERVPGPTTERLGRLARELGVVIVASLFEEAAPGLCFNTTAVLDADGRFLGRYRKAHIPDDPLYFEKFYFTPGDSPWQVFATRHARVGVLICWDQWFPEAARLTAMRGAEVLVYPTAIGTIDAEGAEQHALQRDAWITVQRSHAIANGLHVAAVNRVGREGELNFWGSSFACGPQGEILAHAPSDAPETLIVPCSRQRMRDTRQWWPFFRDRRIDHYGDLTRRWLGDAPGEDTP
ncbi:MAG: acyltransferase [Deltaproteobacteria bacterium]|nr:MAG: acyltransferase [Deltaproteobacteria bacterium]